jgi:plastocyanin
MVTGVVNRLERSAAVKRTLLVPVFLLGLTAAMAAEKPAMVEVHVKEYAIQMPETLPPGPTTFVIHNDGAKKHSFKIEGPGIEEIITTPVAPLETANLTVTLKPGDYKVYCPIGSHEAKGMARKLVVTAPPGS